MAKKDDEVLAALESAFLEANKATGAEAAAKLIPPALLVRLDSWQFGKYGWISPVNLILTACWYKWLNPAQDICKMWADLNGKPIDGGFSIRTQDEKFTVFLVTKKNIYQDFCSSNSGMQGTRALEKIRNLKRISRDTKIDQKVSFDLQLFKDIMNDINDCTPEQAKNCFIYLLSRAVNIQTIRQAALQKLSGIQFKAIKEDVDEFSAIEAFIEKNPDPQFIKCVAIAIIEPIVAAATKKESLVVNGIEGHKTASDARAATPGDFWFEDDNEPIVGVEVKDKSKPIGFDVLRALEDRRKNNPTLQFYFLISDAPQPVLDQVRCDKDWANTINSYREDGFFVAALSLHDLHVLSQFVAGTDFILAERISNILPKISSLKKDTLDNWVKSLKAISK